MKKVKPPNVTIKLSEVSFGDVDPDLLHDFLYNRYDDRAIFPSDDWREYGEPVQLQNNSNIIDMDRIDDVTEFISQVNGSSANTFPTVPSTVFYTVGERDVFVWMKSDDKAKAFHRQLLDELRKYGTKFGAKLFKTKLRDMIRRSLKQGVERDDVIAITNDVIAEEVMDA